MLEAHWVIRKHGEADPDKKYYSEDSGWVDIERATLYDQSEKDEHLAFGEDWVKYSDATRDEGFEPYPVPPVWTRDVIVLGDPSGLRFLALTGIHRSSKTVINPAEAEYFPSLESAEKMARRIDLGAINEDNLRTPYTVRITAQVIEKGEAQCASRI